VAGRTAILLIGVRRLLATTPVYQKTITITIACTSTILPPELCLSRGPRGVSTNTMLVMPKNFMR
jgi:hypothetical protein